MVEEYISPPVETRRSGIRMSGRSQPQRLAEVEIGDEERLPLSISEFARVLGGGIVPGSIILVGGDPGIGKSTLMLQMTLEMADSCTVLYVSGEESKRQIKMRTLRLMSEEKGGKPEIPEDMFLVTETNMETILEHINEIKPRLLVIDSIQTTYARAEICARIHLAGARVGCLPARTGKVNRYGSLRRRSCYQGRRNRRTARP